MSDKHNVIKFPIEQVIQKQAEEHLEKIKKLAAKKQAAVIDGICKEVADSLYEVLVELDYASDDPDFFKDFTYMMESFRSMLLRSSCIKHPIQSQADQLVVKSKPKKD